MSDIEDIKRLANVDINQIIKMRRRNQKAEENVRVKIVIPFIEILGYDRNTDIDTEVPIRDEYHADIVVSIDGLPVFTIECKDINEDLDNKKHLEQAFKYASYPGYLYFIITNGEEFRLYRTIAVYTELENRLILSSSRRDLPDNLEKIKNYLSKKSIKKYLLPIINPLKKRLEAIPSENPLLYINDLFDDLSVRHDKNAILLQASQFMENQEYEKSIALLRNCLVLHNISQTEKISLHVLIGINFLELHKTDQSLGAFKEALDIINSTKKTPESNIASSIIWYNIGIIYLHKRDFNNSLKSYDESIKISPSFTSPWVNKGTVLYRLGRYEEALTALNEAIALSPDFSIAWLNKGSALCGLERYEEALQAFEKAIALDTDSPEAWSNKGTVLYRLGRYEEALTALNEAIALEPHNAEAWNDKCASLYNLKRHEEALVAFENAITINPDYAVAWNHKGASFYGLKRYEEALAAFEKAITINPDYAVVWNKKGISLDMLKRYEKALAAFDKAIALDTDSPEAWFNKGTVLCKLERYEDAMEAFDKAIALEPHNAEVLLSKGLALSSYLGRYEEAMTAFENAITINPNYAFAWFSKGVVLSGLGRHEEALVVFQKAISIDPIFNLIRLDKSTSLNRNPIPIHHEDFPMTDKNSIQIFRNRKKVGRNEPCPCGSGKKYKRCHGVGR